MRQSLFVLCTVGLTLVPVAHAQDDVKKQLDDLRKQIETLQKSVEAMQNNQIPRKDVEEVQKSLKKMEEMQKTIGALDQRTMPRPAPVNYRAEILGAGTQLTSPSGIGNRRGGPLLSPYLFLVRDEIGDPGVRLGIDYGLSTRAEIQRRNDARLFSGEITNLQQQVQQPGFGTGISTTGNRAYFDQNYGRPATQLYRRPR